MCRNGYVGEDGWRTGTADEQGDDAAESVGEEDEFFAEDAGAVGVGVAEVMVLDEGEDDEAGDAHEGPQGGFGERPARARKRRGC
jgi:hypothetical protein